ncbi:MAG: M12 family metallo-peptidase [Saprospiraceae bacterium]|nr:M12 family metallo-peptidase [Saprospiraceae bacterium]
MFKIKTNVFLLCTIFFSFQVHAQIKAPLKVTDVTAVKTQPGKTLKSVLEATISKNVLKEIHSNESNQLSVKFPINVGNQTVILELEEVNIFANGFGLYSGTKNQRKKIESGKARYYHGKIKGDENSIAAISFFENSIRGSFGNETYNYKIEPDLTTGKHIVYDQVLASFDNEGGCGYVDTKMKGSLTKYKAKNNTRMTCGAVNIYYEGDHELFLHLNSSETEVGNYITSLFNEIKPAYDNINVPILLSEIFVFGLNNPDGYDDPPVGSTSPTDGSITANFRDAMSLGFNGDIAQLISWEENYGRGGMASGGLCVDPIQVSYINMNVQGVATIAHELGHNFESRHTHTCNWGPDGESQIDDCGNPSGEQEDNCYDPLNEIIPPNFGGTIMSYCAGHPTLMNGFHPEVGDLIKSTYDNCFCQLSYQYTIDEVSCTPLTDVTFTVYGQGGSHPYQYQLNGGAPTFDNTFTMPSNTVQTITIIDDSALPNIDVEIYLPSTPLPSSKIYSFNLEKVCGVSGDGSFGVYTDFPVNTNLSYTLNGAPVTGVPITITNPGSNLLFPYTTGYYIEGLGTGFHEVVVTDDQGCSTECSIYLYCETEPLNVEIASITNSSCFFDNGSIELSTIGGISPFNYTIDPAGSSFSNSTNSFNGLAPGVYDITVTDSFDPPQTVIINDVQVDCKDCEELTGLVTETCTNSPLPGVTVTITGGSSCTTITDDSGFSNYTCPFTANGSASTISATRDGNDVCGVTTFDLVLISKHILGTELLSPTKQFAADVRNPPIAGGASVGGLTGLDIVEIRSLILHIIQEFSEVDSWRMFTELVPEGNGIYFESSITSVFPNSSSCFDNNFSAVKMGDVTCNTGPCIEQIDGNDDTAELAGEGSEMRFNNRPTNFNISDVSLSANQTYKIPVYTDNFTKKSAYQFSLDINSKYLDFVGLEGGGLPDFSKENYHYRDGKLNALWYDVIPSTLENNTPAFYIVVRAKSSLKSVSSYITQNKRDFYNVIYDEDGIASDLNFIYDRDPKIGKRSSEMSSTTISHVKVIPNPFTEQVNISFESSINQAANVKLMNTLGETVWSKDMITSDFNTEIIISDSRLIQGLYIYSITIGGQQKTGILLKV